MWWPCRVKRTASGLRSGLTHRSVATKQVLGRPVSFEEAVEALLAGFSEALVVRFTSGEITEAESETAARLVREVYGTDGWNGKF